LLHLLNVSLVLYAVWLLWSGHYNALLMTLGLLSCGFVVWISHRMRVLDAEGQPNHLLPRAVLYVPWLIKEIVLANLDVAKRVLSPSMPISPTLTRVKVTQKTDLGRVIYANSITLTPGTISLLLEGDTITVHALSAGGAEDLAGGEMDRRVTALEAH
jgi:multicomponent Na+:H+ antiporter subunit E